MTEADQKMTEALLRQRRLAAEGLLDKPESKESDPIEKEERAENGAGRGAGIAAALRRLG
jgi:hypothetical protein